ncbi:MAG: transporter substrate-binding domain-containing protein [Selenomonadaceae bacterium]|nr:transporter substrate-binding domain-containing protein [Selenomonadaceae bacterium]
MKKFLALICAAILLSGCSADNVQRIGTIKYLNVTETALAENYKLNHADTNCEYVFFDNTNSLLAAFEAGQINAVSTYESVANFISQLNPNVVRQKTEWTDAFCCAMRQEDAALKKEFDAAILEMENDGTLAHLVKSYIYDFTHNATPQIVDMPVFYNDTMIKVAVTGDLPLLDYIYPDGSPAGFNTAVLAEISKRIGKNFILVQVDSGARAAALSSGKVDVIFWAIVPNDKKMPKDMDKPDGVILTVPYFSDKIVHVRLQDKKD